MKLPVHLRAREGVVQAFCPEIPGCSAAARTEQEALGLLRERIEAHFVASTKSSVPGTRIVHIEV